MPNYEKILATIRPEQWEAIVALAAERCNQKQPPQENELYQKVTDFLNTVGIRAKWKGYRYLRQAIILVYNEQKFLDDITNRLYPEVAKQWATTGPRVERAMRGAIERTWSTGNYAELKKMCTWSAKRGRPTNSEFIADAVELLRKM